jgi:hypothetical protein
MSKFLLTLTAFGTAVFWYSYFYPFSSSIAYLGVISLKIILIASYIFAAFWINGMVYMCQTGLEDVKNKIVAGNFSDEAIQKMYSIITNIDPIFSHINEISKKINLSNLFGGLVFCSLFAGLFATDDRISAFVIAFFWIIYLHKISFLVGLSKIWHENRIEDV